MKEMVDRILEAQLVLVGHEAILLDTIGVGEQEVLHLMELGQQQIIHLEQEIMFMQKHLQTHPHPQN